jgi:release factor glutamine methyltransferase
VVQEVEGQCSISDSQFSILDIGTGSGCIAITLAAELPASRVTAWDISPQALSIAQENAHRQGVSVAFEQVDVLALHLSPLTSHLSIIVSNPPYICNKERATMEANVLEHEPHTALFVPDDDPLLFYRAIAQYASTALKPGGWLYFEINPLYVDEMRLMMAEQEFKDVEVRKDQFGNWRMMKGTKE